MKTTKKKFDENLRDLLLDENAASSSALFPSHYNLDMMNPLYPSSIPKEMTLPSVSGETLYGEKQSLGLYEEAKSTTKDK
jgi:hypothetical protein